MAARGGEIMNRLQKVRFSEESIPRCRQEGIIIYPAANQQGSATVPFEFAQPAEQREMVELQRRAVTESSVGNDDRGSVCVVVKLVQTRQ